MMLRKLGDWRFIAPSATTRASAFGCGSNKTDLASATQEPAMLLLDPDERFAR